MFFKNITGHENIIARLRQSLEMGDVGHAYIFEGEKGVGKKTTARAFAKALQCETYGPGAAARRGDPPAPCGCLSCRVFESGNHPDVHFVTGTKAKSIGVDDVREQIIRPMSVKPFRYRYQVFIVDSAETMTPAAQNALLKTVEEPAPYGVFIFLASSVHTLLPTVLSRCVTYKFNPLQDWQVISALSASGITGDDGKLYAAFARGNIGKALLFAGSGEFTAQRELSLDVAGQIRGLEINPALALFPRFEKWKDAIQPLLDMLYLCYRDMIVYKSTGDSAGLTQRDARLFASADRAALKELCQSADAVAQAKKALRRNGNFQLTIELMLLKLTGRKVLQ
ncbi:MAG: DNA polymerase III subunit [Clostridiales bacterium]|jgi:DNA polymerase-3 subunit delta'|nr:DNA polymerase III subunit [Clostridiales bacterium]